MKYGVAPTVMKSRNLVMEAMQHIVRTKYGESTLRYMQENGDFALAGETQGKGDVASLWSILSHTLLRAHQVMHEGIKLHHVNQETCISKNNDSFVENFSTTTTEYGGKACADLSRTRFCNTHACPIDCDVSYWGDWSACSLTCAEGIQTRVRTIETYPQLGGAFCPGLISF